MAAVIRRKDSKGRVLKQGEFQRASDGFYVYKFSTKAGKSVSVYSKTLEGLRKKEEEIQRDLFSGKKHDAKKYTINDMYGRWVKIKKGISNHTMSNYQYMYERYVMNDFGRNKIVDVLNSDIKNFYISLGESGLKANTIDNIHTVLIQVFSQALADDIIRYNPCSNALNDIKRTVEFKSDKKHGWTIDQQKLFYKLIEDKHYLKWKPVYTLMLETGLRIGEVCGLQMEDVDLENGYITVQHNLLYYDKRNAEHQHCGYQMVTPKTNAGKRIVPLTERAKEAIKQELQNHEDFGIACKANIDGYNNYVFLNKDGYTLNQGVVNTALRRTLKECNAYLLKQYKGDQTKLLPKITTHGFRHTFATRLNEARVNDKARMQILGHSDIEVTNEIYTDATKELIDSEFKMYKDYLSLI